MSMRSRKKKICWGIASRPIPKKILRKLGIKNATTTWHAIGANIMRVFGGDVSTALDWFDAPAIAFNGVRPLDLVMQGNMKSLRDHLIRLEYGIYT